MSARVCWGCEHVHLGGRDKPCACGCEGFILSMADWSERGCQNPGCVECRAMGKHPPASGDKPSPAA